MPIYSPTGFLDITNATLRTSNTECQNLQIGSGNVYVTTDLTSDLVLNLENITNLGATTSNTVVFSNAITGLTVSSNLVATGNVTAGTFLGNGSGLTNIPPSAITGTLSQWSDGTNSDVYIASNVGIGNVHTLTSNTLQVGANLYVRDADANVLTVTGNVAATRFVGDGSLLTGIASNLHQVVENGNVTSNTVQFTNATTGFITTSNVEIGGTLKINTISAAAYQSLQSVTDVSNSTSNTVQFTNATTSFTTTSNIDVGGRINMGGHMIPTADNTYDIGSAAFKIRDMYVSDNSLWIGDEAKISFTGNQIKFRRRKKSVVPSGLTTLGAVYGKDAATVQSEALASASGVSTVADMKLHHWMAYAKSLDTTKTTGDIFTDSADDYEVSAASEAFKEVGDDIYSAHNVSIGKSTAPTTALDVNGTVTATAFVGAMPNLDAAKITTGTLDRNTTGSAAKLTATVAIGGVPFDGSADIVPTTFGAATFSGDVAFDTNTLFVDVSANRIGIGTASPLEACDIHGVSRISAAYPKLEFYRTPRTGSDTWGNSTNAAGDYRIHANSDASDGTKRSLNFDYGQNSVHTSRMVINAAGNVGIGTTSPSLHTHIKTNNTGSTDDGLLIENTYSSNTQKTVLRLGIGSANYAQIDARSKAGDKTYLTFSTQSGNGSWGDRMTIDEVGNVGIGTITPYAKLHVVGNAGATAAGAHYGFKYNVAGTFYTGSQNGISIYADNDIVAGQWVLSHAGTMGSSDERIKKEIVDVEDGEALSTIRLLKPKRYKYRDDVKRGIEPVWGFIAQEVADTIPYATQKRTECIPNIYETVNVSASNVITFTNFNTTNLESKTTSRLKLYDTKNTEHMVKITGILGEHSIQVEEDLTDWIGSFDESNTEGNEIFVYGEEVNDFHFLKKDAIWTVATAALQEVDRQLQVERSRNDTLEARILALESA